ncbi:MAG: DUF1080 domain-containing protein, partial [Planctomycetes bacterium]|nr:DUF1080 domain-containing protein [Planctomycetota bacterium]
RSALRIPHSALPPSGPPTPTTQHPTPPSPKWTVYTKWPFDAAEAKRRQEETAKALGVGVEQDIDLGGGVKMTFVLIPAGEFLMGSPPTTSPEKLAAAYGPLARDYEVEFPQHRVRISRPFWIGKYEVTQEQWMAIFGANPSIFKDKPKNPVENVDWGEASGFTEGLSKGLGKSFRLPTEAEWEYACRAGTATEFYFGNDKAEVGAYCRVGGGSTEPVGLKRPNPWGIYDMAGNVWEWCEDCLGKYGGDAQADPRGAATSELRAFRGGSWDRYPKGLRSAYRALENGKQRRNEIGFRVVLAPELPPSAQAAAPAADDDARWGPWEELFDGKTLNGWRVSEGHYAAKGCQAKVEKGQILLDSAARMNAIVWTGRFPTDDYELGLETKALRGPWACCYIVFPVAASQATLHFQGVHAAWVSCVDGEEKNPISTRRGVSLPSRQWCKVLLRVCRGTVQVWVEGEKVIDFPTAGHTLSLRADIADAKLTPLALFTWDEPAALRSIRLRRLKPEGAEAPKAGAWKVYSEWPFDAAEAKRRQEETAKALGVPIEQDIALGGGVKMTFVLIPAGEFLMGSPPTTSPEKLVAAYGGKLEEYEGEFPQHRVNLSRPFWMTKTEVTQEQFMAITQTNPSANKDKPSYPVENVDWNQASSFAKMLGGRLGKTLRLPTEAEWEYACRAGTPTEFYWGDDTSNLADFACCGVKSTAPVGTKKPNTWGLCDTAANVWEWCEDWFDKYAAGAQSDPRGAPAGSARVLRGGSWGGAPWSVRTAYRYACLPGCRDGYIGFRVVLAPDLPAGAQAAPPPEAKTAAWKVYSEWPFDAAEAKRRQEETAKALGVPVEQDIDLGGGVKMAFVLIPAGEFLMGSPPTTSPEQLQKLYGGELEWYQREFPQHRGTLTRPFWSGGRPR